MRKVIITKGLPASGKSTWARKFVSENKGYKRINKDDLRAMLDNGNWSKSNENFVLQMRNMIMESALNEGYSVIIDDTNLSPKHEHEIRNRVKDMVGVEVEIKDFTDVSVEECIKRDSMRAASVGPKVIRNMYNQFLKPEPIAAPEYNPNLYDCYIFDIDGTLAIMGDRSPFDWHKVGEDKVNEQVLLTMQALQNECGEDTYFILLSGRDSVCRKETLKWLDSHGIVFDDLFMRAEGDNRKDAIIKRELYNQHIEDKYNVKAVFDDRNPVVEMWRSLGLICFQVANGDF